MTLALVRVSGMVVFAPFFSSTALPVRTKAVLCWRWPFCSRRWWPRCPTRHAEIGFAALLGELAVGLVYGLTLALLNEMLLFAGQIAGVQFSFSLVNLLDPLHAYRDSAAGRPLSTDGHAGDHRRRARPHSAGFAGAQLSRGSAGHLCAGAGRPRSPSCAPRAAFFWPPWNWLRRCWPPPCWSRLPWRCWAS